MNEEINGCIRITENGYLSNETSDDVREYLGLENLTELTDYRMEPELNITPAGTLISISCRLIAKSSDISPQEIPLIPDKDGAFIFSYVQGDRP
ncbi:hypothetical protein ABEX06_00230 [Bacillus safensis]